jgi:hypothetical protein
MSILQAAENYLAMMDEYKNGKLVRENQSPQAKLIRQLIAALSRSN